MKVLATQSSGKFYEFIQMYPYKTLREFLSSVWHPHSPTGHQKVTESQGIIKDKEKDKQCQIASD